MGFKVNPHRVNIDYEFELFDSAYNPLNRKNKILQVYKYTTLI